MVFAPSCPHPWGDTKVNSVAEEYAHARAFVAKRGLQLRFTGQALIERNGRYFDKLHALDQHGQKWSFCYDINSFFPPPAALRERVALGADRPGMWRLAAGSYGAMFGLIAAAFAYDYAVPRHKKGAPVLLGMAAAGALGGYVIGQQFQVQPPE